MAELGVNLPAILIHTVNILILLFILSRFLFKPLLKLLDDRAVKIQESLAAAERMRQEAARADDERAEALRLARREAEEIVNRALQEGERIRAEARQTAQAEGQRIIQRAEQEATAERQQAMQELKSQVADLAVLAAGRIIDRNLDTQANRTLVDQFLVEGDGRGSPDGSSR